MGLDLGAALQGGLGGFSTGGPLGALAGGIAGGLSGPGPGTANQFIQQDSTSTTSPLAFQQPYIDQLLAGAQASFENPQSQVAGFNPNQIAGQNQLVSQAAPGVANLAQQTGDSLGFLQSTSLLDPNSNPYLQASAQASLNPLIQSLTQQILPNIAGGAVATGGIGGSRQGVAEGNAINQFQNVAGNMLNTQFSNAYQQGLGTMLAANAQSPQQAQLLQESGNILNQVGGVQQQQTQNQLNEEQLRLQQYQNLVGNLYGSQTVNTLTQNTAETAAPAQVGPLAPLGTGLAVGNLLNQQQPTQLATNDATAQFSPVNTGSTNPLTFPS